MSETNYSESSKILNVLTPEHGLIGVISKGCRNMKSKLRGVSRKLVHGTFHIYYKEKGLSTLIGVDVIHSFSNIVMDLEKISYASFILDLTNQVVRQNDSEEIFYLLRDILIKLEEGLPPLPLTNILEIKLLDYLGVMPNIENCSLCGSTKGIVTLSSDQGGFICRECYQNEPLVQDKTIQIIRMFYYVDVSSISKLEIHSDVLKEINQFLDDYYDRFTGLYIKSKDFIKRVNQLSN